MGVIKYKGISYGGGGTSITIDSELNTESTNPVQNKIVTDAIEKNARIFAETLNELPMHMFEHKGISATNGMSNNLTTRVSLRMISDINCVVNCDSNMKYQFFYYVIEKSGASFVGVTDFMTGINDASWYRPENANGIKILFMYKDDREVNIDNVFEKIHVYSKKLHSIFPSYETGSITSSNGANSASVTRVRTIGYLPKEPIYIEPLEGVEYIVYFYNGESMVGRTGGFSGEATAIDFPESADSYRIVARYADDRSITSGDVQQLTYHCATSICVFDKDSIQYKLSNVTSAPTPENIDVDSRIYAEEATVKWEIGGIQSSDGTENTLTTRMRTDYLTNPYLRILADATLEIAIYFYSDISRLTLLETSGFLKSPICVAEHMPPNTAYVRLIARKTNNGTITDVDSMAEAIDVYKLTGTDRDVYTQDVPESTGVLNAILNFKQLEEIKYVTKNTLPNQSGDFEPNKTYKGLPYSSSRPEAGFVPNFVSLYTFMTALQNPNSYLYTIDLGEQGNQNGDTYYGAVCSTSCAYALNIVPNYSTHQWKDIPHMKALECQSVYALRLGDTICNITSGHVVMVTNITRNRRGKIGHITISEAVSPRVKRTVYTPEQVTKRFPTSEYAYYRYEHIHAVEHIQSPFVAVEDEVPQAFVYNTTLIPRKGDKANWLQGVPVEIDVLEPGSYTSVEVYKDDALYTTLAMTSVIALNDLPYGNYKARLTDGTNTSDWCYWIVVDAVSSVTATGNAGEIKVDFSASNAEPLFVGWNHGTNNGTVHISVPTVAELKAGSATCKYQTGSYKVRVAFKTEYGIIHSELPSLITV